MSKDSLSIFVENLIRIRKSKGLSQMALADKANVSNGIIGEIENRHRNPTLKTIDSIAKALDTPIYLLFIDNKQDFTDFQLPNEERRRRIIELLNSLELKK